MKFKDNIGFTLIELLVVVVIIGILAAVGVVSYSGFTNAAKKNVAIANYNSMVKWITIQSGFCEIDSNYYVAVLTWPDCKTKTNATCKSMSSNLQYAVEHLDWEFACLGIQNPYNNVVHDINTGVSGNLPITVNTQPGQIFLGWDNTTKEIVIRMNTQEGGPILINKIKWKF
jgi:prepilin-type N-terminal cleavage/methylation domain-containing protein